MKSIMLQNDHSNIGGLILSIAFWGLQHLLLLLNMPTLAEYSSLCVIGGVLWTFIANADKAVRNIEAFYNWYKTYKWWKKQDDKTKKQN